MTTAIVPSRTSAARYTVTVYDSGGITCTCPAGRFGKSCHHAALAQANVQQIAAEQRLLTVLRDKRALHPENSSRFDPLIRATVARLDALRRSAVA